MEFRYISKFLTSALDGVSVQLHTQEKETPVPTGEEAGWGPEPVWTVWNREKFLVPSEN
jgi:hypothetical protein